MKPLFGVLILCVVLAGCKDPSANTAISPPSSQLGKPQVVVVNVDNGFSPTTLSAKVDEPIDIVFKVKSRGCAPEVIFPELNEKVALADNSEKVLHLKATKEGKYKFQCPMDMYQGTLVVE